LYSRADKTELFHREGPPQGGGALFEDTRAMDTSHGQDQVSVLDHLSCQLPGRERGGIESTSTEQIIRGGFDRGIDYSLRSGTLDDSCVAQFFLEKILRERRAANISAADEKD
jgi:hypothetical protein